MTEQELAEKFQTMMDDTLKGLATKNELKQAVQENAQAYLAEHEADHTKALAEAAAETKKLQLVVADLLEKIKILRADRFSAMKDSTGSYRGVWKSAEMARTFGLFIASDVLGIPSFQKEFEALGLQHRIIDAEGKVKAVASDDIAAGAALAPSIVIPRLLELIEAYSAYRQWAQEYPLGANDNSIPVQTSDPTVYCPAAGVAPTAGSIGFKSVGLTPLEWAGYVAVNRDIDEDSLIPLGELVGRSFARAFGNQEDKCGFIGDGTSTYFNNIGARAALAAVDATPGNIAGLHVQDTAGVWTAIDLDDLLAVAGLLPQFAEVEMGNEIAWICSKAFYLTVMIAKALGAGGAYAAEVTRPDYLTSPTYLGRKVLFGGGMPKAIEAADHCPLLYGNGKIGAAIGDRRKYTVETSGHVKFLERQRIILATERIAINNHSVGDTTDAGAIVGLWADIS